MALLGCSRGFRLSRRLSLFKRAHTQNEPVSKRASYAAASVAACGDGDDWTTPAANASDPTRSVPGTAPRGSPSASSLAAVVCGVHTCPLQARRRTPRAAAGQGRDPGPYPATPPASASLGRTGDDQSRSGYSEALTPLVPVTSPEPPGPGGQMGSRKPCLCPLSETNRPHGSASAVRRHPSR